MSSSVVGDVRESVQDVDVSGQLDVNQASRNSRSERSGKGRRRRAAAEQRRIDQQRWGQYITDEEDECATGMAPRSGNRRRARRNNRNNPNSSHHLEDYYQDELAFHSNQPRNENCDDFDLEMALSLSLSLADPPPYSRGIEYSNQGTVDMSYEEVWCDSQGTLEEVRAKLQMRPEGAIKRERAIAYALSHQQWRSNSKTNMNYARIEPDKNSWGWSWLERWMAAKPWENRLMEQDQMDACEIQSLKSYDDAGENLRKSHEPGKVKVRRNNISVRVAAKPPSAVSSHPTGRSSSKPSSDIQSDESSTISRGLCTPKYGNTLQTSVESVGRPNYMNSTESAKAKIRSSSAPKIRPSYDDLQLQKKVSSYNAEVKSTAGSDSSLHACKLIPPMLRSDKSSTKSGEISSCSYGESRKPFYQC